MEIKENTIYIPEVGIKICVEKGQRHISIIRDIPGRELGLFVYTDIHPDPKYSEEEPQLFVVPYECTKMLCDPHDEGYSGAPTATYTKTKRLEDAEFKMYERPERLNK